MQVLQVAEESGERGCPHNAFQPDTVSGLLLSPAKVLGPVCKEHSGDGAVFDVVGARDRDPDFEASAIGRQCEVLHAIPRLGQITK